MKETKSIGLRLPADLLLLAEKRAFEEKEKSVGTWCKKIIIAELLKTGNEDEKSIEFLLETERLIQLTAISNLRDLLLRTFKTLFASADAAEQFQKLIIPVEEDWLKIKNIGGLSSKQYEEFNLFDNEISEEESASFS